MVEPSVKSRNLNSFLFNLAKMYFFLSLWIRKASALVPVFISYRRDKSLHNIVSMHAFVIVNIQFLNNDHSVIYNQLILYVATIHL